MVSRLGLNDLQVLAAKFCGRAGPGLKAAETIGDIGGGAGEIDQAVFFLEDRSEGGLGMVLWARLDGTGLRGVVGFRPSGGSHGGEARSNGLGGVVGCDRVLVP